MPAGPNDYSYLLVLREHEESDLINWLQSLPQGKRKRNVVVALRQALYDASVSNKDLLDEILFLEDMIKRLKLTRVVVEKKAEEVESTPIPTSIADRLLGLGI